MPVYTGMLTFRTFLEAYTDIGHGREDRLWFWMGGKFYNWDDSFGIHGSAIEQILTPEQERELQQMRYDDEEENGEDAWISAEQYLEAKRIPYTKGRFDSASKVVTFINFPTSSRLSPVLMKYLFATYGKDITFQGFNERGRALA